LDALSSDYFGARLLAFSHRFMTTARMRFDLSAFDTPRQPFRPISDAVMGFFFATFTPH